MTSEQIRQKAREFAQMWSLRKESEREPNESTISHETRYLAAFADSLLSGEVKAQKIISDYCRNREDEGRPPEHVEAVLLGIDAKTDAYAAMRNKIIAVGGSLESLAPGGTPATPSAPDTDERLRVLSEEKEQFRQDWISLSAQLKQAQSEISAAVAAEREECAKLAERGANQWTIDGARGIAEAIRSRASQPAAKCHSPFVSGKTSSEQDKIPRTCSICGSYPVASWEDHNPEPQGGKEANARPGTITTGTTATGASSPDASGLLAPQFPRCETFTCPVCN